MPFAFIHFKQRLALRCCYGQYITSKNVPPLWNVKPQIFFQGKAQFSCSSFTIWPLTFCCKLYCYIYCYSKDLYSKAVPGVEPDFTTSYSFNEKSGIFLDVIETVWSEQIKARCLRTWAVHHRITECSNMFGHTFRAPHVPKILWVCVNCVYYIIADWTERC